MTSENNWLELYPHIANNGDAWSKAFCNAIKLKPLLTGSEWADKYRIIPPGTSPEPGKWDTSRVPYLKEIVDIATNGFTQEVIVMSASQIGKSELLLNTVGYYISQEPSPILLLQPTVEMAQAFSKERIDPMIQYTPELRACVIGNIDDDEQAKTSRKSSNTILKKSFIGGFIALVGSNAPAALASRPIRVVLMDEIDRYGETKEGDPIKLAKQRTRNFHNRKIVLVSTPTFPNVKIHAEFEKTDKREYFIKCPHCNKDVLLEWSLVEWEYLDGDEDKEIDPNTIKLECPHCGYQLRDRGRINSEILARGHWLKTAESEKAGFHLNALYSPWTPLEDLVREYVDIKRGRIPGKGLQEFYNLQLGLPFNPYQGQTNLWRKLLNRTEEYPAGGLLPNNAIIQTAGVDIQRDRIECSVYAWGAYYESWLVNHFVIEGDPKLNIVWDQLRKLLAQINMTKTVNGRACPLVRTFIDSGDGYTTQEVYRFVASSGKNVFAIKGQGSIGATVPFVDKPKQKECNTGRFYLYTLGVDVGKHIIMQDLHKSSNEIGCVHFPKDKPKVNDEFFKQLTAEVFDESSKKWIKVRKRNEALDCAVYARAALESMGLDLTKVAKGLDLTSENKHA